jgi:hypothetical protein
MTTRTLASLVRLEPRRVMSWLFLMALTAAASATGCAKGTYLKVEVAGPGLPDIHAIRMALTLRPASEKPLKAVDVLRNDKGGVVKMPATMAFSLDDDTGALLLEATALGLNDAPVAMGSATTVIMRDETWTVRINLDPS